MPAVSSARRLRAPSPARTERLNAPERRAALRLTAVAQRRPLPSLPDDDVRLARWAGVSLSTWRHIKPVVLASWTLAGGRWMQKRPSQERPAAGRRAELARRDGGERRPRSVALQAQRRAATAAPDVSRCPPAATPADLRALVRRHDAGAIAVLAAIMTDPSAPPTARVAAARALLDRGFGKPTREADREAGRDARPVFARVFVRPADPVT
jgi:uncharacterized protein YdaU (DUF1376 family)